MEFHDRPLSFTALERGRWIKNVSHDAYYQGMIRHLDTLYQAGGWELRAEQAWLKEGRPYYLLYPEMAAAFLAATQIPLDLTTPHQNILVRMPKQQNPLQYEFHGTACSVHTIMVTEFQEDPANPRRISVWIDWNECAKCDVRKLIPVTLWGERIIQESHVLDAVNTKDINSHDLAITLSDPVVAMLPSFQWYTFDATQNIDTVTVLVNIQNKLHPNQTINPGVLEAACRIGLAARAWGPLAAEPDLIRSDELKHGGEPVPLTLLSQLQERAKRRGKYGWHVGRRPELVQQFSQLQETLSRNLSSGNFYTFNCRPQQAG